MNHYSTGYATGEVQAYEKASPFERGMCLQVVVKEKDGKLIGRRGEGGHPYDVAWGFRKLLQYIDKRYLKPSGNKLYVTENGYAVEGEASLSREEAVQDKGRQSYYAGYVREAALAVKEDKIPLAGYMAWSLME